MGDDVLATVYDRLAAPDDEPGPDDTELPGARRARGRLVQWTCDAGEVITDPAAHTGCFDCAVGVAHIGQDCRCLYAVASDRGALAYVEFADGVRCDVYASDCRFD